MLTISDDQFDNIKDDIPNPQPKPVDSCNCEIFAITDIKYDNHILNYPEKISQALKQYSFSDIIDLSLKLDANLINKAITNKDQDLLLDGSISADHKINALSDSANKIKDQLNDSWTMTD